jgi:hypothetical protein
MKTVRHAVLAPVLAVVAAALLLVTLTAPGARAADGLDSAAAALKRSPVYVDPRAKDTLPPAEAGALADQIKRADKPVFVAVLPAAPEFKPATLLQDLRTKVGIAGVYAVALGDRFDAGADSFVMSRNTAANLEATVERSHPGDVSAVISDFATQSVQQARGSAPATWSGGGLNGGRGVSGAGAVVALGVLAALSGSLFLVSHRAKRRRTGQERQELETLRPVVDEDITAFGEELDRVDFYPPSLYADDTMREDYGRALDSYDRAKALMAAAQRPGDVRTVTQTLEEGRFALTTLGARVAGKPLPKRRPPCFFDPRHGPSVQDAQWAPAGGAERTVPVCAADAARLADGKEPMSRQVETSFGRRPYWDAGPMYGPWVYGYFGGGLLPGLLTGTMLGGILSGPHAYGYDGYGFGDGRGYGGGDYSGGDYSGADFDAGDFGGDFGGGGGDFGGGF